MKGKKVAVVIPAFNEEKTLEKLISNIHKYDVDIVVIDDGSTDGTSDICRRMSHVKLLKNERNSGYDKALEAGIAYALVNGYDYVITMDADGQHEPSFILDYVIALNAGYALVVGQREIFQRWSEKIFSIVSSRLWSINDPLCGMKGYSLEKVKFNECSLGISHSFGTELAIRIAKSGLSIKNIPIKVNKREDKSRIGSTLNVDYYIALALLKSIFIFNGFRN